MVAWLNFALHEMTHLHQSEDEIIILLWLKELQAFWIARELPDQNERYFAPEFDARANFFQELLNSYPELNEILFRNDVSLSEATIKKVASEVEKSKILHLFPNYTF